MNTKDFTPKPKKLLEDLIKNQGTTSLAIIHGSYIYADDKGLPSFTYVDTRVYDKSRFIESRFDLVSLEPDVDIAVVVNNLENYEEKILKFLKENNYFEELNYTLTINAILEETMIREIEKEGSAAMKTIFNIVPHSYIGDEKLFIKLESLANKYLTEKDKAYLDQYYKRKSIIRANAFKKLPKFTIDRKEYESEYPIMLSVYEGEYYAGFPKERVKIEIPNKVVLKRRLDIDKGNLITNAHNI